MSEISAQRRWEPARHPISGHRHGDGTLFDAFEQRLGMRDVVIVARRDQEMDRTALRIDTRVDFRREAAAASPHTTISTFFWLRRHADARARSSCG
jgi:hypothetical protein